MVALKKILKGIIATLLIFVIAFSAPIALPVAFAQTPTSYYTPQNTNYANSNTFGGQVFNTGTSALIGCSSGILAGEAAKGIGSLISSLQSTRSKQKAGAVNPNIKQPIPVTDSETESQTAQTNKISTCLDAAAYAIAQKTLEEMSQRTLNWVNTGLGGNPLYVTNVGSYFKSIQDRKVNDFLGTLDPSGNIFDGAIRSSITKGITGLDDGYFNKINADYKYQYQPFAGAVMYCAADYQTQYTTEDAACLTKNYTIDPNDPGSKDNQITQCKFQARTKYDNLAKQNCVAQNIKQFNDFQKDFTNGGWDSWLNAIENDNNNPIGAVFNASDKLSTTISSELNNARDEINRNGGFLDMKVCVQYETQADNWCIGHAAYATSSDSYETHEWESHACTAEKAVPKCLTYQTTTPGKIIADQINEVTKSPIVNAENITKINQVLQSFFTNLLNNFLQGGLGLLQNNRGSVPSYATSFGTNAVYTTNGGTAPNPFASITTNSYDTTQFDISRPQDLRAVIQAQADYINKIKDAQQALHLLVPLTGKLDYCLPGPNPTWADTVDQNFNELMSSMTLTAGKNVGKFIGDAVAQAGGATGAILSATGVGAAVGLPIAAGAQLLGFLLGLIPDNEVDFSFDNPALTDKSSGESVSIGGHSYVSHSNSHNIAQGDDFDPPGYFEAAFNVVRTKFARIYSPSQLSTTLGTAFSNTVATQADKDFAKGFVAQALSAVQKLPQYGANAPTLDADYQTQISDTESMVAQLAAIKKRVDAIVTVAKARYIAEQKAAGTPVDQVCIDNAYKLDGTAITGVARQTSDLPNPDIQKSEQAAEYFYTSLKVNP